MFTNKHAEGVCQDQPGQSVKDDPDSPLPQNFSQVKQGKREIYKRYAPPPPFYVACRTKLYGGSLMASAVSESVVLVILRMGF